MKITQNDVRIGIWWSPCCISDLTFIATESDLESAKDPDLFRGAWETCAEAVDELIQEEGQEDIVFHYNWNAGQGNNPEIAREIKRHMEHDKE